MTGTAYYNEIDPCAAAWLRELINAGLIADGEVDTRSICDVRPDDLRGFTQCHFFAGIGGWPLALRMAGWDDARPVWTGSCPCQPFSVAGKGKGTEDERHLWPEFYRLIAECRPAAIFGEQVAGKAGVAWLAAVRADLESSGYAVGAADLCAAGVGAPHIRQRLYWVAHTNHTRLEGRGVRGGERSAERTAWSGGVVGGLADADSKQQRQGGPAGGSDEHETRGWQQGAAAPTRLCVDQPAEPLHGHWRGADWLACRDGKWRPVEPGTFPLVAGLPSRVVPSSRAGMEIDTAATAEARVMRLRGYGNAINPILAAEFIGASMEAWSDA